MKACPACHGDGAFNFSDVDAPLGRLARMIGVPYIPHGIVECDVCEGAGTVTDQVALEWEGWAAARRDQFLAAVDSGELVL